MRVEHTLAPMVKRYPVVISTESDPDELPGVTWQEYRVGPHCFILAEDGRFYLEDGVARDSESLRQLLSLLLHPDIFGLMVQGGDTR